jgi:DNA gyrase inhibitor GyrI
MIAAVLFRRNLKPYSPYPFSVSSISTRYQQIIKMNEKKRLEPVFLLLFTQLLAQSILQVRRFPFAYSYFSRPNPNPLTALFVQKYD